MLASVDWVLRGAGGGSISKSIIDGLLSKPGNGARSAPDQCPCWLKLVTGLGGITTGSSNAGGLTTRAGVLATDDFPVRW